MPTSASGSQSRLSVKILALRQVFCRPLTPYLGVRTNSLGFFLIAPQIASNTALALFKPTPTPRLIRNGRYREGFPPACFPNRCFCPEMKNVLAGHGPRVNQPGAEENGAPPTVWLF